MYVCAFTFRGKEKKGDKNVWIEVGKTGKRFCIQLSTLSNKYKTEQHQSNFQSQKIKLETEEKMIQLYSFLIKSKEEFDLRFCILDSRL